MRYQTTRAAALLTLASLFAVAAQAQRPVLRPASQLRLTGLPAGISDAKVRAHEIEPAHVRGIQMEETDPAKEVRLKVPRRIVKFKTTPQLDVAAFGTAMHAMLKDKTTGYVLQVRKNGHLNYNLIWNWAQTPADAKQGWSENTRMHVASVSKFLTAVGMVKALDAKGISYDAKISGYLPGYWSKGSNIDDITFRHLLTHRSGFSTGSSSSSYAFMRDKVADGVSGVGSYDYENMNFGLCRILIPIINGNISKNATFSPNDGLNDVAWDAVTLHHYKNYMQAKVFSPAGVANADFAPVLGMKNAFAYKYPHNGADGWNSGNLASVAGGAAWRLSTKELLNVMNHVRRKNTIIPAAKAQYMLDNRFGIDQAIDTPAGKTYNKNGAWRSNGRTEQCVAYFFPNGMEVAVFVNSPIGEEGFSLRGLVQDTFEASLKD